MVIIFAITLSYFVYDYGLTIISSIFSFVSYIIDFIISFNGLLFILLTIGCSLSIVSFLIFNKINEKERKEEDNSSYLGYYFHQCKKDDIDYIGKKKVAILDDLLSHNIYIRTDKSLKGFFYSLIFSFCSSIFFVLSWLLLQKLRTPIIKDSGDPIGLLVVFFGVFCLICLGVSMTVFLINFLYILDVEAYLTWREN
jgi:hypothetical protein